MWEQAILFSALDQRRLITVTIKEDARVLHWCWCRQQLWPATTLLPKLLLLNMGSELRCHLFREAFPNSLSGPLLYAFLGRCSISLFHLSHCAVTPPFVELAVSCRSPYLCSPASTVSPSLSSEKKGPHLVWFVIVSLARDTAPKSLGAWRTGCTCGVPWFVPPASWDRCSVGCVCCSDPGGCSAGWLHLWHQLVHFNWKVCAPHPFLVPLCLPSKELW